MNLCKPAWRDRYDDLPFTSKKLGLERWRICPSSPWWDSGGSRASGPHGPSFKLHGCLGETLTSDSHWGSESLNSLLCNHWFYKRYLETTIKNVEFSIKILKLNSKSVLLTPMKLAENTQFQRSYYPGLWTLITLRTLNFMDKANNAFET